MPAERDHRRRLVLGMIHRFSVIMLGSQITPVKRVIQSVRKNQMHGDFMTCMEMFVNGARIGGTFELGPNIRLGLPLVVTGICGAVPGTMRQDSSVPPIVGRIDRYLAG
jgi:hypothetical protein